MGHRAEGRVRKGTHPNSLAALARGRDAWKATRTRGEYLTPDVRRQISAAGAKARAEKFLTDKERDIRRLYGPEGLTLYRQGKRDGGNRVDQRWRSWYAAHFGGTARLRQQRKVTG